MRQAWPLLYTVLLWWLSTGVILYLNTLPRATHKWSMASATVLLGIALCGVAVSASDTRVSGAYIAFTSALTVWGWQEVGFLLGYVTGPRRLPCPPTAHGWTRVRHAIMAILYHEIALIALAAAIAALTWQQPNKLALWIFVALWLMRLSAKLNVFLGVRNLNEDFLPDHMRYLHSYFRQRPTNRLFPTTVIAATGLAATVWHAAFATGASPFGSTAHSFVATLLSLAVLEHWFMVLPLPSERLWQWSQGRRTPGQVQV